MPSDTRACPFCGERCEAAATSCGSCHSELPPLDAQPSADPHGDKEILGREPKRSRSPLMAAGILVVVLVAYGATHMLQPRPQHRSEVFNMFAQLRNACEKDDGNLVTTDPHGTPTAYTTPDGPARYWCVSRSYLTSIGRAPQDPPPPIREVPSEYKWLWPRTTYGP